MMTTKVFQRVLATFLVVAAIFLANGLNNVAHATRVQLYDKSLENFLDEIEADAEHYEFIISKPSYYKGKDGLKYCELYFNLNKKNRIVFQLNNNETVSSAWIIFPIEPSTLEKHFFISNIITSTSIFWTATMQDDDMHKKFTMDFVEYLNQKIKDKSNSTTQVNVNKTFSYWCANSNRYIDVKFFRDDSDNTINYHIFAHT